MAFPAGESAWRFFLSLAFRGGIGLILVLIPLVLLRWGADDLAVLRDQNQRAEAVRRLEKTLQPITRFEKGEWFAQAVLEHLWARAERSPDPIAVAREGIARLKKRFPGYFRFVVWDDSGKLVENLTDVESASCAFSIRA